MVAILEINKLLHRIFLVHWPRKLVALITAVIVWFLVTQTLTITKNFTDIPVKIINLPKGKTIVGLLPNDLLQKRLSLSVTGNKSILEELDPKTLEVIINAEDREESWIAKIDKKSLISLAPNLDLKSHITEVNTNDIFLDVSDLVVDEILVTITKPIGDPPKGYQFLDVWPKYVRQKVSGPAKEVYALKESGIQLTFNLNRISSEELDQLSGMAASSKSDEISFYVPKAWKEIPICFKNNELQPLNDPAAKYLRIVFLKQELISLNIDLPITIFFPVEYSRTINPQTYSLATNELVHKKNGLKLLNLPLYVQDVSRLFLDIVRNNLLFTIIASPKTLQPTLNWTVECIDPKTLEDAFVKSSLEQAKQKEEGYLSSINEAYLRNRFRHYLRQLQLYLNKDRPLQLEVTLDADTIAMKLLP